MVASDMPTAGLRDPKALAELKTRLGATISVCLPARDEEATVGHIVASVRRSLVERVPLVDEVVVMDDGSSDATADAAEWEGARVHRVADVLPSVPPGSGKGNALWRSLFVTEGSIVVWIDADVRNFRTHFVTRLVEPLLTDPTIGLVKGYYRRPLHGEPTGGGRVTELMARPVLSTLFPHLSSIVQPLGGEYAGRRELLEVVPFVEGWGVEIGLLIDVADQVGVDAIAQRDLGVREHRNRPLDQLSPQAMAVLVTALRRAGIPDQRLATSLMRFTGRHEPVVVPVDVNERPPMLSIPEYRAKLARELSA
ncbi:MAG: glucosyl-3-phosphoglycerate synthase [Acidimicrobiia bacterium]|jgi:glucosyl-3-phosphoglycerate synthase